MARPMILDLYSGAGGAASGYHRAGFDVLGVDIRPQPHYPFDFVQADAIDVLEGLVEGKYVLGRDRSYTLEDFAAIHASPPCQRYSSITKIRGNPADHPDLIDPTRRGLRGSGLPYVIENVVGARSELLNPVTICAQSMGLFLDEDGKRYVLARHRLFETNWFLMVPPCACDKKSSTVEVLGVYGGGTRQDTRLRKNTAGGNTNKANTRQARLLMEMPWANRQEMNLAIPPRYTEHIGRALLQELRLAT